MKEVQYTEFPMIHRKTSIKSTRSKRSDSERHYGNMEISKRDMQKVRQLMFRMGSSRSITLRAVLRLGLERASELGGSEKALMSLVRLGKL